MIKEISEHRSVRNFADKTIPEHIMMEMLGAATRASTIGTMQLYSIIVTTNKEIREMLKPCHFNQPAANAPALVTFCADVARFEQWCEINNAKPDYKNFIWFVNATIDTLLAAQNFALQAQANGLAICYLGTTLYNADKIIQILDIPHGVIPITTLAVGYAAEESELTHRLPIEAVAHFDKYQKQKQTEIQNLWKNIENSEQTKKLIQENNLSNLAKIFTEIRYKSEDNRLFSKKYMQVLKKQGFIE